jgi:hypothetical protein
MVIDVHDAPAAGAGAEPAAVPDVSTGIMGDASDANGNGVLATRQQAPQACQAAASVSAIASARSWGLQRRK